MIHVPSITTNIVGLNVCTIPEAPTTALAETILMVETMVAVKAKAMLLIAQLTVPLTPPLTPMRATSITLS